MSALHGLYLRKNLQLVVKPFFNYTKFKINFFNYTLKTVSMDIQHMK